MSERLKRAIEAGLIKMDTGLIDPMWTREDFDPRAIARAIVEEYDIPADYGHTLIGLGEVVAYEIVRDLRALAGEEE